MSWVWIVAGGGQRSSCLWHSPVPNNHDDLLCRSPLHGPVGFVCAPPSTVAPINLQDLVPKAQPHKGSRGVDLYQLHEEALGEAGPSQLAHRSPVSPPRSCLLLMLWGLQGAETTALPAGTLVPHFPGEEIPRPHSPGAAEAEFQPWLEAAPASTGPQASPNGIKALRTAAWQPDPCELGDMGRVALSNRSLRGSWWVQASGLGGGAKRMGS